MRIKGLALREAGHVDAARELWTRVIESEDEHWPQVSGSLEHLGDSYRHDDPPRAATYYRRLIADYPTLSGTSGCAHVSLAEILLDRRDKESVEQAARLLGTWIDEFSIPFPNAHFRFNLAVIRAAKALGDKETTQRAARTALDLAARGPVYPRHGQEIGDVKADAKTLRRLRRLAK